MYLNSVKFNLDANCIKAGQVFEFKDKNIIVGDQGCGKSTLLRCLSKQDKVSLGLSPTGEKGVKTYYFDSETDNPRVKNPLSYSTVSGESKGIGAGAALASMYKSHGEVLAAFTVNVLPKVRNCVIFIDEPESGLSVRNQYRLVKELNAAVKRKCQLFIATHCLPVIQNAEIVLSLEHNKWMLPELFLKTQATVKKKITN